MAAFDNIEDVMNEYMDQQKRMTGSNEATISQVDRLNKILEANIENQSDLIKHGRLTAAGFDEMEKQIDKLDKEGLQVMLKEGTKD